MSLRLVLYTLFFLALGPAIAAWVDSPAKAAEPLGMPDGVSSEDWPWWRGPMRNGAAPCDSAPLTWSKTENVVWRAAVPGRGHASPTIAGARVILPTADETAQTQSILCFHRETGDLLWEREVHRGKFVGGGNAKSTQASASVACDGERIFINFLHDDAVFTSALSLEGEILWQKRISGFVNHQGFGASPAVYGALVLVSSDNKGGGVLAGLNGKTGEVVWSHDRPKMPNYTSPIVLQVEGRAQALFSGCELLTSLDPLTGEKLWEVEGATTECVTSTVTSGGLVYSSGGYPRNHIQAVKADGSGTTVWENKQRVYVPSMLEHEGYLYASSDDGIGLCLVAATGEEAWKTRLEGKFTASPVRVGDRIYATSESGRTVVFRASPERYEQLAENQLGDQAFATPAICGGRIYHRVVEEGKDGRQEWLYCLGE